jgi:hypothetical protein
MTYKATRDVTQARVAQSADETIEYTLTTTNVASNPTSPTVKAYDLTNSSADVSTTVLTGSASASGDVITLPTVSGLTAGQVYQIEVKYTVGNSTFEQTFVIVCQGFSYIGDLSTNRDKVRFHLNDTDPGNGPLPEDRNFSDNEIDGLITAEGTWQRAIAAGLEALARAWTRHPTFKADGLNLNRSDIAKGYREEAKNWRARFGYTIPIKVAGQIPVDAYSDDVTTDDVDTTSEYEGKWEYVTPA